MPDRPVWVEISQRQLLANYEKLRRIVPAEVNLAPVVKANAYGHDALLCGPLLANAGAKWLGVTGTQEGVRLRKACIAPDILLMSGIFPGEAAEAIEQKLTPSVWEPHHLDMLEEAAARRAMPPASVPVHLELDTGMSRQGVRVVSAADIDQLAILLHRFHSKSALRLTGVMTHFSRPEAMSSTQENPQLAHLLRALDFILARGHRPEWLHAGNSTTAIAGPDRAKLAAMAAHAGARLMLRPGLALYGYLDRITYDGKPVTELSGTVDASGLIPVLTWKTRVSSLRTIQRGESAGYGDTFSAKRPTRLALLPAGYADGINRLLSNRGHFLIRGQRAPIAGRISMDQTVLDVSDIPGAAIGDEVVLIGRQGDFLITAWDLADLAGTIAWEVLCAIHPRVPRIAVD